MSESRVQRRLAAILAADVVGYSRLIREDEEGTLSAVGSAISEVFTDQIERHNGRVFKTMGDGLLAEFPSVVDAVRCAVDAQQAMKTRNQGRAADRMIEFRVGINLGDIIADGDDLHGDGVNVASRLESLAEPSGILISASSYEQVRDKLDLGFEDQGEQRIKNIDRSVRVYRVMVDGSRRSKRRSFSNYKSWQLGGLAALCLIFVLAGGFGVWQAWSPTVEPASVDRLAFPLPDKPSIAVLPFNNISDDPSQEYFVDGMTEDLITDLSKISGLFVISRNSTFVFKGRPVDVKDISKQLGVRYVLEGSARRAGDQIRINAQLIDATTGGHIWAERFDETMSNVFTLQDKVTRRVVSELAVTLTVDDKQRLASSQTENVEAYEAFLRGWEHYRRNTPDDFVTARDYFQKAVDLDPKYGRAHAALALIHYRASKFRWSRKLGMGWNVARLRSGNYLQRAWENPTPLAHRVASEIYLDAKRTDDALEQANLALSLNSNDPESHAAIARSLIFLGRASEALGHVEKAMRLDVNFPAEYGYLRGLTYFGMERFGEAAIEFENAIKRNPENYRVKSVLAATYAYLKREKEAKDMLDEYFEVETKATHGGKWSEYTFRYRWPYKHERDWDRLAKGLVDAAGHDFDIRPPGSVVNQ